MTERSHHFKLPIVSRYTGDNLNCECKMHMMRFILDCT